VQVTPGGNHPQLAVPNTELQGVSAQPSDPVHASRSEAGDPGEQEQQPHRGCGRDDTTPARPGLSERRTATR